ncbi:hypothetical protein KWH35_22835, partial [Escherichia coli]
MILAQVDQSTPADSARIGISLFHQAALSGHRDDPVQVILFNMLPPAPFLASRLSPFTYLT